MPDDRPTLYSFVFHPKLPMIVGTRSDPTELPPGELPADAEYHVVFMCVAVRISDPRFIEVVRDRILSCEHRGQFMPELELRLRYHVVFSDIYLAPPKDRDYLMATVVDPDMLSDPDIKHEIAGQVFVMLNQMEPRSAHVESIVTAFARLRRW